MLQKEQIQKFLDCSTIAVAGVSRSKPLPANGILKKLKQSGYTVFAVNPHTDQIDGVPCYPDIQSIPDKVEAVMIAGHPSISEDIVRNCIESNIQNIWMHRGIGNGSYSEEAESICKEHGIEAITNGCPMMFIKPVDPFHFIFRYFK
jgi:predicted CoA-binding protein